MPRFPTSDDDPILAGFLDCIAKASEMHAEQARARSARAEGDVRLARWHDRQALRLRVQATSAYDQVRAAARDEVDGDRRRG